MMKRILYGKTVKNGKIFGDAAFDDTPRGWMGYVSAVLAVTVTEVTAWRPLWRLLPLPQCFAPTHHTAPSPSHTNPSQIKDNLTYLSQHRSTLHRTPTAHRLKRTQCAQRAAASGVLQWCLEEETISR